MNPNSIHSFRRVHGINNYIHNDFIPLMKNVNDTKTKDAAIRVLLNLTLPIEFHFQVDFKYRTELQHQQIFEVNEMLLNAKEAFIDPRSTKCIINYIKLILENRKSLTVEQCNAINNCLLLIRNILHIPENNATLYKNSYCSMKNNILWNLFTQRFDKLLLFLMSFANSKMWCATIVQIISLLYKDQHVCQLRKMLSVWFEAGLSDSSEDDESNTSPLNSGSGISSPISQPNSDNSDNSNRNESNQQFTKIKDKEEALIQRVHQNTKLNKTEINKTKKAVQHQHSIYSMDSEEDHVMLDLQKNNKSSETIHQTVDNTGGRVNHIKKIQQFALRQSVSTDLSDYGYVTQLQSQESFSTSSNEEANQPPKSIHKRIHCTKRFRQNANNPKVTQITIAEKAKLRHKKLVKRSKSKLIKMKGLFEHQPTEDDISNLLKEFSVDFLLKGFKLLVQDYHSQLISDAKFDIDTSYFFWLIKYFLMLATELELDLKHVDFVLSFDVLGYITYEGICLCETFEATSNYIDNTINSHSKRIHLIVISIREILQAIEIYKGVAHLNEVDQNHLKTLELQICSSEDLRNLFVLLLRLYKPSVQSKQYLQDLIVTNHMLLLLLDKYSKMPENKSNFKLYDYVEMFASVDIMQNYGFLLQDFQANGEFVNDCIFNIMHHICGDLQQTNVLFQPLIIKTFSEIIESKFNICVTWFDLVEYVTRKFLQHQSNPNKSVITLIKEHNFENSKDKWTPKEEDALRWYYARSKSKKDLIGNIVKLFQEDEVKKSRKSIIQQLLHMDIIMLIEYDDLLKNEDMLDLESEDHDFDTPNMVGVENNCSKCDENIENLKQRLCQDQKENLLIWVKKSVLSCRSVKLNIELHPNIQNYQTTKDIEIMEPCAYYCIIKHQPIPLVPWTSDLVRGLDYQTFIVILKKLGFCLPSGNEKYYVRIPESWTSDIMLQVAQQIDSITKNAINSEKKSPMDFACDSQNGTLSDINFEEIIRQPSPKLTTRLTPKPKSPPPIPDWLEIILNTESSQNDI